MLFAGGISVVLISPSRTNFRRSFFSTRRTLTQPALVPHARATLKNWGVRRRDILGGGTGSCRNGGVNTSRNGGGSNLSSKSGGGRKRVAIQRGTGRQAKTDQNVAARIRSGYMPLYAQEAAAAVIQARLRGAACRMALGVARRGQKLDLDAVARYRVARAKAEAAAAKATAPAKKKKRRKKKKKPAEEESAAAERPAG